MHLPSHSYNKVLDCSVIPCGLLFSIGKRKTLESNQEILFQIMKLSIKHYLKSVFSSRILLDLLRMNVAPLAIFQMLRSMCAGQRVASTESVPEPARG